MFLSDSATINRTTFANNICYGEINPVKVIDIIDCTVQLSVGRNFYSIYIAIVLKPHMYKLGPTVDVTRIILFYETSNMQGGGDILTYKHPRFDVLHVIKHTFFVLS